MSRTSIIVISLLTLLIGGYLVFYYQNTHEVDIDLGPVAKIRTKPFYAAEKFLAKKDIVLKEQELSRIDLEELSTRDTLFLLGTSHQLNQSDVHRLASWVERGGYLVISNPKTTLAPADPSEKEEWYAEHEELFLDYIGIGFQTNWSWGANDLDYYSSMFNRFFSEDYPENLLRHQIEDCQRHYGNAQILTINTDETRYINLYTGGWFIFEEGSASVLAKNRNGKPLAIETNYGDGKIYLLTSGDQWLNHNICEQDHAQFLLDITTGSEKVWMITHVEHDSFFTILISKVPYIAVALVLCFLLWVWRNSKRFGPIVADKIDARRSLAEHLAAHGSFMRKYLGAQFIVENLRKLVEGKIARMHPTWHSLERSQKLDFLEERLRQVGFEHDRTHIETLLFSDLEQVSDEQMVLLVRELQTIRKSL